MNWQVAIDSFRGELLEGVSVAESDLSTWLEMHRGRIREAFLAAFATLLESPSAGANPRTVQSIASRVLEIDPCQEPAYRAMMRAFAALRAVELVAITFEKCRSTIEHELGTVPSQLTIDLFLRLQAEVGRSGSPRPPPPPLPRPPRRPRAICSPARRAAAPRHSAATCRWPRRHAGRRRLAGAR